MGGNAADIVAITNQADVPATTNSLDLRVLRVYSDYYFIQSEMVLREDKEA